jgi:hypothetical protein
LFADSPGVFAAVGLIERNTEAQANGVEFSRMMFLALARCAKAVPDDFADAVARASFDPMVKFGRQNDDFRLSGGHGSGFPKAFLFGRL